MENLKLKDLDFTETVYNFLIKYSIINADYFLKIHHHIKNEEYETAKESIKETLKEYIKIIGNVAPVIAEGILTKKDLEKTLKKQKKQLKCITK
ncbi:hypothetical protein J4411_00665 [Candidatus Pacearchaeota archaeon]|nr:hypothetical protein [uncultured archaeon]AQS34680.1 hypothetical protein [uncultured archaeon]MBS3084409.1 hypothetical protein [Candidatus Pacearchaeota archaeon]